MVEAGITKTLTSAEQTRASAIRSGMPIAKSRMSALEKTPTIGMASVPIAAIDAGNKSSA
jgi:hypothetical protein